MDYQFSIEEHPGYLHAIASGDRTAQNAQRFLIDAHAACMRLGYSDLLVEMRLEGDGLDLARIFQVVSERSSDGRQLRRIAYVDVAGYRTQSEFAETVALNRGVNTRLFADLASAARWLSEPAK